MIDAAYIIGLWPSVKAFAEDHGIKATHVHVMKARRSIPPLRWPTTLAAAKRRGIDLTLEMLVEAHGGEPSETPTAEVA